ncbi:isoprenylcysteine carboxylmethyltransferase family protein [Alkalihalobacillus sp. LMS39]|uniref:isoprenylcysteine carboxyl methyltransferase family protein n=1 Tax=Alkalihalobacillus sp. LMS39 TaxID=2924032 RepID=UPI001FB425EF|nr:isoprenylcysteine carboxylmethyltransferase family protein [Alkalihalobacillus sp. LMS39]UOE94473.1 isoprenylcysteine carboxyl methyltransferase [Alkalihalobacillus sp. LMS39]
MLFFLSVISIVVLQRVLELLIANRNATWIKKQGGYEVGQSHYKYMVLLHIGFFASLLIEVLVAQRPLLHLWPIPFSLFVLAQAGRVWSLSSLGRFWNTRIMILPGAKVVAKGPYRFIRHPNYCIVLLELITLPLLFQAYFTLCCFLFLKLVILSIRIPLEEKALIEATNYQAVFYPKTDES